MHTRIRGSIVAIVTPFQKNGELDLPAFRRLIDMHLAEGTDAILCCGTTGEILALSEEERLCLIEETVDRVAGKIPVIAGVFSCVTKEAIKMTQEAKARGVDACLGLVPYFTRPSFEGVKQHITAIADVGLPTILYNHPSRTSLKLTLEQLVEICEHPNIFGVKEGSGEIDMYLQFTQISNKTLFSDDDVLALPQMSTGAKGIISIVANIIPRQWHDFAMACLEDDYPKARALYRECSKICRAMIIETNPQPVKYALSLMGLCEPTMRLPLVTPRESTQQAIRKAMESLLVTS